jgi:Domain of unknown function (DUF6438)
MRNTALCIVVAAVIFFLTISACKTQGAEKITHFDLITLERTVCFGSCPIYKLSIRSNGSVEYDGIDHVKIKGQAKTQISPQQVAQLVEAVNAVNFFGLRDKYQRTEDGCKGVATDNPSVIISIKIGDREKTVDHYHGCLAEVDPYRIYPANLVEFEDKIDKTVGTSKWTGKD